MEVIKASDERFNACYAQTLDAYPQRKVTTLAFRLAVDGSQERIVTLSRSPGSRGDDKLAKCVGTILRRIAVPLGKNVAADFKIQFAHVYQRDAGTVVASAPVGITSDARRVARRNQLPSR